MDDREPASSRSGSIGDVPRDVRYLESGRFLKLLFDISREVDESREK